MPEPVTRPAAPADSSAPSADTMGSSLPSAVPPPSPPLLPAVPGYEVLEELGRGGMGVVYKARQRTLDRVVALKMILAGDFAGPEEVARLRKEAEALGRLQHPNIVQIFEVGEAAGRPFCALEYVEGGALDRKLAGAPQPPREAAALVETLARAVHAAHQRHVVHRDLKPANILLTADGVPKITDFGLAKRLDEEGRTASGAVMGTPSYMAPEQARGRAGEVGPAADVYALGAILYELLTGRPPFRAETPLDTMLQVLTIDPPPPRQLQAGRAARPRNHLPEVPAQGTPPPLRHGRRPGRRPAPLPGASADRGAARRRRGAAGLVGAAASGGGVGRGAARAGSGAGAGGGAAVWFWQRAEGEKVKADQSRDNAQSAKQKAETARGDAIRAEQAAVKARQDLAEANDKLDQSSYLFKVELAYRDVLELQFGPADRLLGECPPARRQWEWNFVHDLRRACVQSFRLPAESPLASSMAVTPDGGRLAVAWALGVVQVWDLRTKKQAAAWDAKPEKLTDRSRLQKGATSLAFSRDGKRLAGAPGDGAVRVWDAVTGKEERRLEGEPGEFACPAFSPDGARIAVPLENGPIKVWELASGREEHSLKADEGASYQNVVFSPDGKRLAAAGFHDLAAWDLEGEKPLLRLDLGKDALVDPQTLFFTPDGGAVEYVTLNPGVVFNVRRFGKDEPERKVECSNLSDTIAALSPDARRLALKDKDGEITLWDLTPGREVAAARWTGSTHGEYFGCLAFSGDGGRLINVNDEDVTVWDTGKPYPQRRLAGQAPPISSITLSRDGGRLAAGGDFGVVVWDAADGRTWSIDASAQKPFQFTPHPAGRPSAFSPDGKRLVCPAAGALRVWDLDARKEERTLDVGGKDVTTVAWAADGRITALTEDGVVRVWGEGAEPERTWTCPNGQSSESRSAPTAPSSGPGTDPGRYGTCRKAAC